MLVPSFINQRGRGKKGDEPETSAAGGTNSTSPSPLAVKAAIDSYLLDTFRADESIPPLMVRLAWHDAGAFFVGGTTDNMGPMEGPTWV